MDSDYDTCNLGVSVSGGDKVRQCGVVEFKLNILTKSLKKIKILATAASVSQVPSFSLRVVRHVDTTLLKPSRICIQAISSPRIGLVWLAFCSDDFFVQKTFKDERCLIIESNLCRANTIQVLTQHAAGGGGGGNVLKTLTKFNFYIWFLVS